MRTQGIKDLYLPKRFAKHVKMFLFCAIFTPLWGLLMNIELSHIFLIGTFSIMLVDIEILRPLSVKFFTFRGIHSRKEITRIYLLRLVLFLITALVVCILTLCVFLIILHWIKGWEFYDLQVFINKIRGVFKVITIALLCSTPLFFL